MCQESTTRTVGAVRTGQARVRSVPPLHTLVEATEPEWLTGDPRHRYVEVGQQDPVPLQQALLAASAPVHNHPG